MSLFLGHVHYWLYDKIKWFEALERDMHQYATDHGFPSKSWKEEHIASFGAPVGDQPLEDVIDTNNIHGWLQDKIHRAEGRHAALVTKILSQGEEHLDGLKALFAKQGAIAAGNYEKSVEEPVELFNALNDFILEGMPCDRVNEVVVNDENVIQWIRTTCLHSDHWDRVDGKVENFYALRDAWIGAFVENLHPNFTYQRLTENTQAIKRTVAS
ncbi:hypothetical protein J0B03_04500 [Alkalibacter rhizosphaerae]|uniref:Uncharacterized protein n=1 Tax=Alkalibacter rhizosphaerae TaxID=2815577 RepID=A0A974XGA5_9FIRM|nr:hypothetical protein [Alkalibacter rhizosphaerae]QSX09329.1 hypothetical protein J0B03_04500 [Alkalibacter rhizosphaerae]